MVDCTLPLGRGWEDKYLMLIFFNRAISLLRVKGLKGANRLPAMFVLMEPLPPHLGLCHCKHNDCCHNRVLKLLSSHHSKCHITLYWQGQDKMTYLASNAVISMVLGRCPTTYKRLNCSDVKASTEIYFCCVSFSGITPIYMERKILGILVDWCINAKFMQTHYFLPILIWQINWPISPTNWTDLLLCWYKLRPSLDWVQSTWGPITSAQHLDRAKSSKRTKHLRERQVNKHSWPPKTDLATVQHWDKSVLDPNWGLTDLP